MHKLSYIALLSALLAIGNVTGNLYAQNSAILQKTKKSAAENLEQIIIPRFDMQYDIFVPFFFKDLKYDAAARWKSYIADSTGKLVVDGVAKVNVNPIGIKSFYSLDIEFRTYFDEYGRPKESIVVTRDDKNEEKNELTSYDSIIVRREFPDCKDIKTLGHTIFDYDNGVARTPSNNANTKIKDTIVTIDRTVLDMQSAYFMLVKKIFEVKMPFNTTLKILHKGAIYPVDVKVEKDNSSEDAKDDAADYDRRKMTADFTYIEKVDKKTLGERKTSFDGIKGLTVIISSKTRLPTRVEAEMDWVNPYAKLTKIN